MNGEQALILVVDDNEMNRDILARRLHRQGYRVVQAENGVVALAQMRQHTFDLILLDIMMPEMNGFQVLEHLKAHETWRDIPVIVISAADDMDSIVTCIELGAEDYLSKPYNTMLLRARIGASLEKKRLRDAEKTLLAQLEQVQAISQELSRTGDGQERMGVVLGWALRHADDQAGFIGTLVDGRIRVLAAHGYTDELTGGDRPTLDDLPAVQQAIRDKKVVSLADTSGNGLLFRARSQLAVPICLADEPIAVLVLENPAPKKWPAASIIYYRQLAGPTALAIVNAQLEAAVKAADAAKTDYVARLSHELTIPMTAIKGYTDMLLAGDMGEMNEVQNQFLDTIRDNVTRLARLVSDLTDISLIESHQLLLERVPLVLMDLVADVVQSCHRHIAEKSQRIVTDVPASLPPVYADPARLSQVLTILLLNAQRRTPENGQISLQAQDLLDKSDPQAPRHMIRVAVADTGLGIPEEAQALVFARFADEDSAETRQPSDTALGLNLARSLVTLHDGRIWFETTPRRGTIFYLTLPVA